MDEVYRMPRNLHLCGAVGVCAMTLPSFLQSVFTLPTRPVSATVALVGIPAVVAAVENERTAAVYNTATIAAVDGMPIVKKARRSGIQCDRCSGPDFMGAVFAKSVLCGKTHYLYGGKNDEALDRLRERLQNDYPGIQILGAYSPPYRQLTPEEDSAVCAEINCLRPDFVWVGIGAPKQEIWMDDHRAKIVGCVMLGVGAGFDFLAGTLSKAPRWMEQCSLEWLYRLCKEPRRLWKRYILGGVKYACYSLAACKKPAAR